MKTLPNDILEFLSKELDKCSEYREGIVACCPFHDELTPSFFVFLYDDVFFFKCQGCEKSGTLHFLLKYLKGYSLLPYLPKLKQIERVDKPATVESPFRCDTSIGFPKYWGYFNDRGISDETCSKFGFVFDFRRVMAIMPVYTEHQYKGYIGRLINPVNIKYYIESGMDKGRSLFAFDEAVNHDGVFIVEGQIDAATLWESGRPAVALLGKSYKSKLDLLKQLKDPIIIPDNEPQSIDHFYGLSRKLGCNQFHLPSNFKDVNDFWLYDRQSFQTYFK